MLINSGSDVSDRMGIDHHSSWDTLFFSFFFLWINIMIRNPNGLKYLWNIYLQTLKFINIKWCNEERFDRPRALENMALNGIAWKVELTKTANTIEKGEGYNDDNNELEEKDGKIVLYYP